MMRSSLRAAALMLWAAALCSAAYAATPAATPAPVLTVEGVLSPAWVERVDGRREPLSVGMTLNNREKVHTGDGGRALLRLAEGSAIKLGESGMLALDNLVQKRDAKSNEVVGASLDVVRGAFRFTTGLLGKSSAQRDVTVKVRAVTAGIRGTDVWGKSEVERDVVCLLEGRVTVNHGTAQFTMQEPLSFYIAPLKGQAQPPSSVSMEQVRQWSAETEIDPRMGGLRSGGMVSVTVASGDERTATAQRNKLRDSGFPAEIVRVGEGASARHEVRITSLADGVEAAVLAERLRRLGFPQARTAQ